MGILSKSQGGKLRLLLTALLTLTVTVLQALDIDPNITSITSQIFLAVITFVSTLAHLTPMGDSHDS